MTIREKIANVRWGSVIIEQGELSMGRVMCWIVFGTHIWFWCVAKQVPNTMYEILLVLFAYNFGKKFTGPLSDILRQRLTGKAGLPVALPAPPQTTPTPPAAPAPQTAPDSSPDADALKEALKRRLDATRESRITEIDDPFTREGEERLT